MFAPSKGKPDQFRALHTNQLAPVLIASRTAR